MRKSEGKRDIVGSRFEQDQSQVVVKSKRRRERDEEREEKREKEREKERERERERKKETKIEADNKMTKRVHSQRADPAVPYSLAVRRERSRELAQKRRTTYKSIMSDLAQELPFSRDVISQVDYNSRLRLALCYFRMKSLSGDTGAVKKEVMEIKEKPAFLQLGMLQDFMTEVFVCVCV